MSDAALQQQQNTAPPSDSADTQQPWTAGLDADTLGYVQNKGWGAVPDVVTSYRNLEKVLGVPKEQIIQIPKAEDKDAWGKVFNRLGRPEDPKHYEFGLPKEADPAFVEWAQKHFHELGLTKAQAKGLTEGWSQFTEGKLKEIEGTYATSVETAKAELKTKWGAAEEKNLAVAAGAARAFGVDKETIDKLEQAMGYAKVMEFFHTIGEKLGEDQFVTGGRASFNGALSPEQARSRITALKTDADFVKRYTSGDIGAKDEMERLHKYAYPS